MMPATASGTHPLMQTQALSPSVWQYLLNMLLGIALAVILGAGSWLAYYSWNSIEIPIKKVVVVGELNALNPQLIRDAVVIYQTDTLMSVPLERLVADLQRLPWVASVAVERRLQDGALLVSIEEQRAIAYWGERQMVNTRGELFEHRGLGLNRNLPRMWSALVSPAEAMNFYQIFERQLQQADLKLYAISQSLQGDWQVVLDNRARVLLDYSNPSKSIRHFVSIYQQIIQPLNRPVKIVDLRYRHGAAIQWNNTTEAAADGSQVSANSERKNSGRG